MWVYGRRGPGSRSNHPRRSRNAGTLVQSQNPNPKPSRLAERRSGHAAFGLTRQGAGAQKLQKPEKIARATKALAYFAPPAPAPPWMLRPPLLCPHASGEGASASRRTPTAELVTVISPVAAYASARDSTARRSYLGRGGGRRDQTKQGGGHSKNQGREYKTNTEKNRTI